MLARSLAVVSLLVLQSLLPGVSTAVARTISWSGYTWDVRPSGSGAPGPNLWSDSPANVQADGSDLVLSIVKEASGRWTSAEIDNQQHLGYGTYRWVVESDLSTLDANDVLGMFTYGGSDPSNNEIDIEPSHWGNLSWPTGSATVWQDADAGRSQSKTFSYSNRPPYLNQFKWEPGRITYLITDAAGATLFAWTVTSGVPIPSSEVPVVNYWRFENAPPAGPRSMRLASFSWTPLEVVSPAASPPAAGGQSSAVDAVACRRVTLRPRRFTAAGRRRGTTIAWTAAGATTLRLAVERHIRQGRFFKLGTLTPTVSSGAGSLRFKGKLRGRRLPAGRYRLVVRQPHCTTAKLSFTVVRS